MQPMHLNTTHTTPATLANQPDSCNIFTCLNLPISHDVLVVLLHSPIMAALAVACAVWKQKVDSLVMCLPLPNIHYLCSLSSANPSASAT